MKKIIRLFNIIKKTYPELHDLIQFSDLYDHQIFNKPKSQFLDCFRIEIEFKNQSPITIENILSEIMLPIKNRFKFNVYFLIFKF